jgi:ribosome-associated heat shock protein Hsp15
MDDDIKDSVRLDKWLWAVRLFKTRIQSNTACKNGKISMAGKNCKASKLIKIGDVIKVKVYEKEREIIVKGIISKRVSAKLAVDLYDTIENKI